MKRLSKSMIVLGHQCTKAFWLKSYKPALAGEADASTQLRFDEGNMVGEFARRDFPRGHLIEREHYEIDAAITDTQDAIDEGKKIIMEAAFRSGDLYARADIIRKTKSGWDLIEVKSGTSAKETYVIDVAIQAVILELAGLKVSSVSLKYLNRDCVHPDLSNLFETKDVSVEVKALKKNIQKKVVELRKVLKQKSEPKIANGNHCSDPYECSFKAYCWKDELPAKSKGTFAKAKVNPDLVREELSKWKYPLYFFDFETLAPAIPRYKGTSPYGGVPFQFSCHVLARKAGKASHFEYLQQTSEDPRPGVIKAMLKGLGTSGSIVSYNKGFEIGVIRRLAEFDPKNRKKLMALVSRFVDPLPLIRKAVSHPDFVNGYSLKVVAPALIGEKYGYSGLAISDGMVAQAWAEKLLSGEIPKSERGPVVTNLLEYCRQDTMAMVELFKFLIRSSSQS